MTRLDELVRAARDVGGGAPDQAARTRRAILAALAARPRRRKRASVALLLVAAVAGGTAWAATPRWLRVAGPRSDDAEPSVRALHVGPRAVLPPRAQMDVTQVALAATASASVARPAASPAAQRPARPAVDALYLQAHRAHFLEHDYERALGAWDRYLSVAPRDPRSGFVLEARYNRAICLFRLGRVEEGRAAIEPFSHGGYREAEARALLDSRSDGDTHETTK